MNSLKSSYHVEGGGLGDGTTNRIDEDDGHSIITTIIIIVKRVNLK
jgi:hypothetical protein